MNECKEWLYNLSKEEQSAMLKAKYNRDISQLSQNIVETWQECINVYKGVKDHNNLTSVDHYKPI